VQEAPVFFWADLRASPIRDDQDVVFDRAKRSHRRLVPALLGQEPIELLVG
jgi:hypothetical protein